jgi:hypothetical protein
MRLAAFVALLVSVPALAGCASQPTETQGSPANGSLNDSANETNVSAGVAFLLQGPILRGADGKERDLFHEDDAVTAHYEIGLTPSARTGATAFASFIVNGKVLDIQSVHLEPGEHRAFDPALDLGNGTAVRVEVKVGAADGKANATVARWPRPGGTLALGNATAKLASWQNETGRIYVELEIETPADGSVGGLHVKLLCLEKGKPVVKGDQAPDVPPGQDTPVPLDFAACAAPYGLSLSATEAGNPVSGRFLVP